MSAQEPTHWLAMLLFITALFAASASAQATGSPSTWTWENYKGTSSWSVQVTEDDTGCGDQQPMVNTYAVTIQHDTTSATVGDLGHGPFSGAFSGNTLHVQARTVQDGSGTSQLSAYEMTFTPDCTTFDATYSWNYNDQYQSCSGTTRFHGTNTDAHGCPGPAPAPTPQPEPASTPSPEELQAQISAANADLQSVINLRKEAKNLEAQAAAEPLLPNGGQSDDAMQKSIKAEDDLRQVAQLQPQAEHKFEAILNNDPTNFWANMGMAQLRQSEGDNQEYVNYLAVAVTNPKIYVKTSQALQEQASQDLGLPIPPTPATSPFFHMMSDQANINNWQGGTIYNVNAPPAATSSQQAWTGLLKAVFFPKYDSIAIQAAGLPGSQ